MILSFNWSGTLRSVHLFTVELVLVVFVRVLANGSSLKEHANTGEVDAP